MLDNEIMVPWKLLGRVEVAFSELTQAIEILTRHGETTLCLRLAPHCGWVISKMF
jgi:hypothetical protein